MIKNKRRYVDDAVLVIGSFVLLGLTFMAYRRFTTPNPDEYCEAYRITNLMAAVGHKNSTSYLYELENDKFVESYKLHQIGDYVCYSHE